MSKIKIYLSFGIALLLLLLIGNNRTLRSKLKEEKAEKERYQSNSSNLLSDIKRYKTNDSLNVAKIGTLQLTISEYKQHRSDDLKLIESLKIEKKKLLNVTSAQTKTIQELKGTVSDSIVYRDNFIIDTLKCVTIHDKWFDLIGCSDSHNNFKGKLETRDSLKIINYVKQKRFLGFLWHYGKKENKLDVLSKNPNTSIEGVEYIEIVK